MRDFYGVTSRIIMDHPLTKAIESLRPAQRILVFTGAGMSADSGIPTFRDALTGLWARFDAERLATPEAFRQDPALVWGWYEWRRGKALRAQPNAGHLAIAALQHHVAHLTVVTQNVDDLHERAGSRDVIHLHGSLHRPRCFRCGSSFAQDQVPDEPEGGRRLPPPVCDHCGGPIRPGVVWFGEALPTEALAAAEQAVHTCDGMIVVGTSGLVFPAARIPMIACRLHKPVIVVDPHPPSEALAEAIWLSGRASALLPALVAALKPAS